MSEEFRARLARLSPEQLQLLALDLRARLDRVQAERHEPIAIVGMGCRFPGAADPAEFWRLLSEGRDGIREIPPDRWNADEYFDANPDTRGTMATRWGGFLDRLDLFDAEFFGIAPREAASMDPQQRLLLEVTWEALENAAVAPDRLKGTKTGVFVGISTGDYFHVIADQGYDMFDAYGSTGGARSVASGRLSYVLGLEGPAVSLDTACSSSLMAVHLAVRSIRSGECSMAIAGGVNAIFWPGNSIVMSRGRMMAANGRCKVFDAAADGFVRSEGCGVIVLKRLSDAVANGDRVLAVIRGTAANQDGRSNGLTAPNGRAQASVVTDALADGGVAPASVSYVEAHGTGTPLGDPIELHALGSALSPGRDAGDPVFVGSVKSNIGHLEAAAGMAGLIKTILMLQHRRIAPSLHFNEPNPFIDWASIPIAIPTALQPWTPPRGRRVAGVSSFGVSGSNAHVVLEEAPADDEVKAPVEETLNILALSARSEPALRDLARRYEQALAVDPSLSLADFCLTVNVGRAHFEQRAAIVARTTSDLRDQLRVVADGRADATVAVGQLATTDAPRVAFLFTGQGAQYVGMGAQLMRTEPVFRAALERCAAAVDRLLPSPLLETIYAATPGDRRIHDTRFTQPAMLALQFALSELWQSWGITPSALMGHSLGEYAAACVAGVMSIEDALLLVAERARLMASAPGDGAMLVAFVDGRADVVAENLARHPNVSVAAYNGPDNTVFSGPRADIDRIGASLAVAAIEVRPLEISHAFHSKMVEPVLDEFERAAARLSLSMPRLPLISNLSGALADETITKTAYWRRHLREPVRFRDGMATLVGMGTTLFLEVGPHPSLIAMARRYTHGESIQWLASIRRDRDDLEQMVETLGALYVSGASVEWKGVARARPGRRIAAPTYPFQRESFWVGVPGATSTRRSSIAAGDASPVGAAGAARDPSAQPKAVGSPLDVDQWLYEIRWDETPLASQTTSLAGERWLVVGGPEALNAAICEAARKAGATVASIDSSAIAASDGRAVNEQAFVDRFAGLIDLAIADAPPTRVVHLDGVATHIDADTAKALTDRTEQATRSALTLARAVIAREWNARVWFITAGATSATGANDVAAGTVWGFARSFANEHPELSGALIDVDTAANDARASAIVAEVAAPAREAAVAFANGRRVVGRLVRLDRARLRAHSQGDAPRPTSTTFRAHSTQVVTGALGGIGMKLVDWLATNGADHIALLVRRDPTVEQAASLAAIRARGVDIRLVRADVAIEEQVQQALDIIRADLPPISGVFHLAGRIDDAIIQRMEWIRFAGVLAPKVVGAWNLHTHTRQDTLDHFVLFASGAGILGPIGLSNHAAANAALDTLAHLRRAEGLPGVSLDWGWWAGTGAVEELSAARLGDWAQTGFGAMDSAAAFSVMSDLISPAAPAQTAIFPVNWPVFRGSAVGRSSLFAAFDQRADASTGTPVERAALSSNELRALAPDERLEALVAFLHAEVARELGIRPERIALGKPLTALGLDSLMAVQLRNRVQTTLDVSIPLSRFIDGPSVRQLAVDLDDRLASTASTPGTPPMNGTEGAPQSQESAADASQRAATDDVAAMSDAEVEAMLLDLLNEGTGPT